MCTQGAIRAGPMKDGRTAAPIRPARRLCWLVGGYVRYHRFGFGGSDAEALVWREGIVIGAQEPLATALKLLAAGFSKTARWTYVYSNPQLLTSALALLPDRVKSRYVPGADSFIDQARRERAARSHEQAAKTQAALRKKYQKIEIKPRPKSGQ